VLADLSLVRGRGLRLLQVLNAAVAGLALGIAIGRVAETVGSPCPPGTVVHLAALYDLVGALPVFSLPTWLGRRARWEGQLILTFTIGYGLVRLVQGVFRTDKRLLLGLDASQLTAAVAVAVAIALFLLLRHRARATAAVASGAAADRD
jgi:prolipoprotein diacylglyceryltransferase